MPDEQLYREFQSLDRKIQMIINENKKLKDDLHKIKKERNSFKIQLETQRADREGGFQDKTKISKLVPDMKIDENEGDATALKNRIDDYIREIDKCIAYLTT